MKIFQKVFKTNKLEIKISKDFADWGLGFSVGWDYVCELLLFTLQILCINISFSFIDKRCDELDGE